METPYGTSDHYQGEQGAAYFACQNRPDTVGPERRLELKLWADKFRPAPLWKRIRRKLIRAGVVFYGKVESSFPASSRVNATYPVPGASTTRP